MSGGRVFVWGSKGEEKEKRDGGLPLQKDAPGPGRGSGAPLTALGQQRQPRTLEATLSTTVLTISPMARAALPAVRFMALRLLFMDRAFMA